MATRKAIAKILGRCRRTWQLYGGDDPQGILEDHYLILEDEYHFRDEDLEAGFRLLVRRVEHYAKASGKLGAVPAIQDLVAACTQARRLRVEKYRDRRGYYRSVYLKTPEAQELIGQAAADGMAGDWSKRLEAHRVEWVDAQLREEGLLP